mgnify:CR=1 FL=1
MATHIQIHRSAIAGATPSVETMLEGEVAVNLTDKKLFVKGATGELITLVEPQTHGQTDHVTLLGGASGSITLSGDLSVTNNVLGVDESKLQAVTTFNGATGDVQGMSSFNGLTGDVTSGISFSIHGITFSDNTFQRSASQNGFRYKTGSGTDAGNDAGRLNVNMDSLGEIDFVSINTTDLNGTNLKPLFTLVQQRGGIINVFDGDYSNKFMVIVSPDPDYDGSFSSGENETNTSSSLFQHSTSSTAPPNVSTGAVIDNGSTDFNGSLGKDAYVQIIPNTNTFITEFNGSTGERIGVGGPDARMSIVTHTSQFPVGGLSADGMVEVYNLGISGPDGITFDNGLRLDPEGVGQLTIVPKSGNATLELGSSTGFIQSLNQGPSIKIESGNKITLGDPEDSNAGTKFIIDSNTESVTLEASDGFSVDAGQEGMTVNSKLTVLSDIVHKDDDNTKIEFTPDTIKVVQGGDRHQLQRQKDTAQFSIISSSAVDSGNTLGHKVQGLKHIPYDATFTNVFVRGSTLGGLELAINKAGSDPLGHAANGATELITANIPVGSQGVSFSSGFSPSGVSANDFIYLRVKSNNAGATAIQALVTYTRD